MCNSANPGGDLIYQRCLQPFNVSPRRPKTALDAPRNFSNEETVVRRKRDVDVFSIVNCVMLNQASLS
jgi:hypothetical protein